MADDDSQFCDSSTATIPAIDDDGKGGEKKRKAHRLKQRFKVVKKLGQGTYGKVQLAINNETGQEVSCFLVSAGVFFYNFTSARLQSRRSRRAK